MEGVKDQPHLGQAFDRTYEGLKQEVSDPQLVQVARL